MQAVAIEEFGGRDKLRLLEVPDPQAGAGEVRIRVQAAGVNPIDWKIREGLTGNRFPYEFPLILGWEAAGVVDQVGEGAQEFAAGDAVYTYCRKPVLKDGAYAEWVAVEAAHVARRPRNLSPQQAAGVPLAGLTAYQALFDVARMRGTDVVLVHGAAGGVGHLAVQLARSRGARVLGTAGPENHPFLAELGAELAVDYRSVDFVSFLRNSGYDQVDVVIDTVGGDTLARSAELLRPGGRIVSIVDAKGVEALRGRGVDASYHFVEPSGKQLAELTRLCEEGELTPHVAQVVPLAQAAAAHELIETGHGRGKIVIAVNDTGP